MDLRLDDFADCVGETYDLIFADATVPVVLEQAQALPPSVREAGAFRLEWRGPGEPILKQAIYRFRRGSETYDMFMVPIACDGSSTLYEAIFN